MYNSGILVSRVGLAEQDLAGHIAIRDYKIRLT